MASVSDSLRRRARVTVRASPGNGYALKEWDGSCAGPNETTCTVTLDRDRSVTARFNRKDSQ